MDGLDIVAEVGYRKPLVLDTTTMVTDGMLTIEFVAQVENPKISALEVMDISQYSPPTAAPSVSVAPSTAPSISQSPSTSPRPSATPAWKNIHINCGGPEYISNDGLVTWQADAFFTGGGVYVDGSNDITPTADDPLFQSERHGTFTYEIPVPVGNYEITVHLAEL
jgi:Malectin domain